LADSGASSDLPQLTLSEVAKASGLTRAAARRLLLNLVQLGLAPTDGRVCSLRPRVLELGYAYLSALGLPEAAQPHLERLGADIPESASISVLDGAGMFDVVRPWVRSAYAEGETPGSRVGSTRMLWSGPGRLQDDCRADVGSETADGGGIHSDPVWPGLRGSWLG